MSWGSVPDWVAAVGTVGALLVALFLLKREIDDRRARQRKNDMKPATQVFGWVVAKDDSWGLKVQNNGDEPVFDLVFYATPPVGLGQPTTRQVLFGTVPPKIVLDGEYHEHPDEREDLLFGFPSVEIEFTDGRGRHWLLPHRHQVRRGFPDSRRSLLIRDEI